MKQITINNNTIISLVEKVTRRIMGESIFNSYRLNELVPITRKVPSILFHRSNHVYRDSIMNNGLVPSVGASYESHSLDRKEGTENEKPIPVIFLSDNDAYDSGYDDDLWAINTSMLDKDSLFQDFDESMYKNSGAMVYTKPIPPEALKLVYKGSDKYSEDCKLKSSIQGDSMEFTFMGSQIGGAQWSIGYVDDIESEYSDSIDDFEPRILKVFDYNTPIVNIEDIWVNKRRQGQGFFRTELKLLLKALVKNGYHQFILRACPDKNFPQEKMVEIDKDFGFSEIQETEHDGVIMYLKK